MSEPAEQLKWSLLRRVPVQKRARERVESVLDAAAALLDEKLIADITTDDIADRAGVPVGSVYHYFESKLSVLAELTRRTMARADAKTIAAITEGVDITSVSELVDRAVDIAIEAYRRAPGYAHLLRQFRPTPEFAQIADEASERVAEAIASHPFFAEHAPPGRGRVIARTAVEAANTMQRLAFEAKEPSDAVDYVAEMKALLTAYLDKRLDQDRKVASK